MTKREKEIFIAQVNVDAMHYKEAKNLNKQERALFFLDRLNRLRFVGECLGIYLTFDEDEKTIVYREK